MKILLTHRYFWPDSPPYAIILKKIATRLAADGHDVTVLSTQPSYKMEQNLQTQAKLESIDGYQVRRLSLLPNRILVPKIVNSINMFLYFVLVLGHGIKNRNYDVVMNATSPPILAGLAGRLVATFSNAKHYYHLMDIHPEIGRISGEFSKRWLFNLLLRIDSYVCNKADHIFVLSEDMKSALLARPSYQQTEISVIQNFDLNVTTSLTQESGLQEYLKKKDIFRIIFAGNIGRFQNLEAIVDAFLEANPTNIQLVLLGDGKIKNNLIELVNRRGGNSVIFFPHQTVENANIIIRNADMGLISLTPGIYQFAYPTKLISYLSVDCPIIAVVEEQSVLANFINEKNIGFSINPENISDVVQVAQKIINDKGKINKFSESAKATYEEYFKEQPVLDKWSDIFRNSTTEQ